jgi:hypothetical protein
MEVNRTDPSPSVRLPWLWFQNGLINASKAAPSSSLNLLHKFFHRLILKGTDFINR